MPIDHVFIFTEAPAAAVGELLAFGLTEGSGRVHAGQGTANRKFYFENFFLEILWVQNEAELRSPATLPSKLWQRARNRDHDASPYGLCLANTPDTDAVFAAAKLYQPAYLPAGQPMEVLAHEHNLSLPWTFRLPFNARKNTLREPVSHRSGLQRLTRAVFGLARYEATDSFQQRLTDQPDIQFQAAPQHTLALVFDHHRQGKTTQIPSLNLMITY